jgi:hypothetical protein
MVKIYIDEDYSANNPSNFIENEVHTVQSVNHPDYFIIIPAFFPFYENNIHVWIENNGVRTLLNRHTEYELVIPYTYGEIITGRKLYCAISIFNKNFNGVVKVSYQAFGGKRTANRKEILRILADKTYNLREANWNQITGVPSLFIPSYHYNYFREVYGQDDHVDALSLIASGINQKAQHIYNTILQNFSSNFSSINHDDILVKKTNPSIANPLTVLNPVGPLDAGTVNYVQNQVNSTSANISSLTANNSLYLDKGNDTANRLYLNYTPTNDLHAANLNYLQYKINLLPRFTEATGVIKYILPNTISTTGYLRANGAWVPISAYPDLFSVIGHNYGYTNYIINTKPYEDLFLLSPNASNVDVNSISFSSFNLQP